MIVLYILLGLLALPPVLLCIPVGFRLDYAEEPELSVRVLGVKITLLPAKDKPPKSGHRRKEKPSGTDEKKKRREEAFPSVLRELKDSLKESGVSGAFSWLCEVARILTRAAGRAVRAITVRRLDLRVEVAGEDAAETALRHGKLCAVLYPALGVIESRVRVRRQSVRVVPAFLAEETTAVLALRGHVWPIRLVWAGLCALASFIKSVVKLRAGNPAVSREEIGHGKECTERARRVDGKNS